MEKNERNCLLWLNHIKTFRTYDRTKLIRLFGNAVSAYEALKKNSEEVGRLLEKHVIKASTMEEIVNDNEDRWLDRLLSEAERKNIKIVTLDDPDYPERLACISAPPLALFMRGRTELLDYENGLGVIGSRRPTHYGVTMADEFSKSLSRKGFTIISGMAMGIDAMAHQAALESGGNTIAVFGGGVDICYPQTNYDIFLEMCEKGLILSEYEPGEAHVSIHFPARNRIISGLSDAVLVVEAALRSGTLITADFALEQNKDVFAVPGRVTDMLSKGTNNLIKQGAILADSPADILIYMFGPDEFYKSTGTKRDEAATEKSSQKVVDQPRAPLNEKQKKLLSVLGFEPVFIDNLIRINDMNITDTLHQMKVLTDLGYVRVVEQSYYILSGKNTCN
ncbi:MAG: DNA-processing protein DprA [Eubacterium sp.]|nr:DNA-processing protein DprA [Eubacterium sp.]